MAWGPQPHQIGNLALVRGGGAAPNAKLLLRQWFRFGDTISVPAGGTWIIGRAVGAGGSSEINGGNPGGGGLFAREDRVCLPGQVVAVTMSPASTTGTRAPTVIKLDGVTICQAESGQPGTQSAPGLGGSIANSIGTVRNPGGAGAATTTGSTASAGVNGGQPGSGSAAMGGGSGGESNAPDALILGGRGADANNGPGYGGRGGFPGGGASTAINGGNQVVAPGGDPVAVVEIWSAKP